MSNERVPDLLVFVAAPNSGKSHDMAMMLQQNRRNIVIPANRSDKAWSGFPELKWEARTVPDKFNPTRTLVQVHIPELHTFTGTRVLHADGEQRIVEALADPVNGYHDGGLFLDDFRRYIYSNGTLNKKVSALFGNRRHHMLDIFCACHAFQDISGDILKAEAVLVIGRTAMPPSGAVEEKGYRFAELQKVIARVNDANAKLPDNARWYKEEFPWVV